MAPASRCTVPVALVAVLCCVAAVRSVGAATAGPLDEIEGLGGLMNLLGGLGGTGAGGGAMKCEFKCSEGITPTTRPGHVPTSNGCGPAGLKMDMGVEGTEACCDVHDKCYHTCGAEFAECEKEFTSCLDKLCASQKTPALRRECDSTKGLMQMGTGMMGCSSFKSSQEDACECRRADGTIAQSQYALDQISEAHGAAERGGKGALPGSKAGKRRKRRTRKPRRRKPRSEL